MKKVDGDGRDSASIRDSAPGIETAPVPDSAPGIATAAVPDTAPGFATGLRHGIPIALGYFTVSIALGLAAAAIGFPTLGLAVMSATNLSSSGQFAGVAVVAGGTVLELALTTLLVNLRYLLMSMSLSQRLDPSTSTLGRLVVAYGVTDEIFAVELGHRVVRARYAAGLMALPIVGWTSGTVAGAVAGEVLPASAAGPMGVLLYAMFTATVVPALKRSRPIAIVAGIAAVVSALIYYVPATAGMQAGWRIIVATVIASAAGAWLFPQGISRDDGPSSAPTHGHPGGHQRDKTRDATRDETRDETRDAEVRR
ncbi:AzlC family ABC transporter permease [Corynebacterium sp. NPDC060344]|uniref:AzlC family ABC transporter permease n=1 Tax=Corynebacterium sp. NPDC060344 TaxID=3347101 RepID=UPI0036477EB7